MQTANTSTSVLCMFMQTAVNSWFVQQIILHPTYENSWNITHVDSAFFNPTEYQSTTTLNVLLQLVYTRLPGRLRLKYRFGGIFLSTCFTLRKTAIGPEDGWLDGCKTTFLLRWLIFRGYVSFTEGKSSCPIRFIGSKPHKEDPPTWPTQHQSWCLRTKRMCLEKQHI